MNTQDIALAVASQHDISQEKARNIVNSVLGAVTSALAAGEEVSLHNFGKFSVINTAQREGRNPRTGEAITIKAQSRPKFSASSVLKSALNG